MLWANTNANTIARRAASAASVIGSMIGRYGGSKGKIIGALLNIPDIAFYINDAVKSRSLEDMIHLGLDFAGFMPKTKGITDDIIFSSSITDDVDQVAESPVATTIKRKIKLSK